MPIRSIEGIVWRRLAQRIAPDGDSDGGSEILLPSKTAPPASVSKFGTSGEVHQAGAAVTCSERVRVARLILVWATMAVAVGRVPASATDLIRTGGTGASLGLVQAIGEAFMKANPDIRVESVPSLGSSGGIKAVRQGAIDIGFSSRPLKPEEQTPGIVDRNWVTTPFVLVKNDDSASHDMTIEELEKIYTGVVTKWPDGERIRLVLRPAAESDTRIAREISPVLGRAIDSLLASEGTLIAVTDQECLATIAKVPGAVGFSTLAQVTTEKRAVSILSIGGVVPSVKSLLDGNYHLMKPLYIVSKANPSQAARRFLEFLRSEDTRSLLTGLGAVPGQVTR